MDQTEIGWAVWVVFNVALVALLTLDLFVLSKRVGRGKFKAALALSLFWVGIGVSVGFFVLLSYGTTLGTEYFAAYIAEKALGVDNLFVFMVLFAYFKLPAELESYALTLGIAGALVARALFIVAGVALVSAFSWVLLPLGAFLLYTSFKLWTQDTESSDPSKSFVVKTTKKLIPISSDYMGRKVVTKHGGRLIATPLLVVMASVMLSDLLFATDSIPTVIGISQNSFVVWASNATAVLGLRPLFFLLVEMVDRFRYLHYGLALVLGYIGAKLIFEELWHLITGNDFHIFGNLLDTVLPLVVIVLILGLSVLLSSTKPAPKDTF